jgi:hypothetical protein
MPRLYKKEINFCDECPVFKKYLDYWGEVVECICLYKPKRKDGSGGRKIVEMPSSDKDKVEMPKWCPLEKIES